MFIIMSSIFTHQPNSTALNLIRLEKIQIYGRREELKQNFYVGKNKFYSNKKKRKNLSFLYIIVFIVLLLLSFLYIIIVIIFHSIHCVINNIIETIKSLLFNISWTRLNAE